MQFITCPNLCRWLSVVSPSHLENYPRSPLHVLSCWSIFDGFRCQAPPCPSFFLSFFKQCDNALKKIGHPCASKLNPSSLSISSQHQWVASVKFWIMKSANISSYRTKPDVPKNEKLAKRFKAAFNPFSRRSAPVDGSDGWSSTSTLVSFTRRNYQSSITDRAELLEPENRAWMWPLIDLAACPWAM